MTEEEIGKISKDIKLYFCFILFFDNEQHKLINITSYCYVNIYSYILHILVFRTILLFVNNAIRK